MARRQENAIQEHKPTVECRHHWLIDGPDGPTSWGLCKYCGAAKEFLNHFTLAQPDYRSDSEKDSKSVSVGSARRQPQIQDPIS